MINIDKILVFTGSIGLIGFIYWFFLGSQKKSVTVAKSAKITVSGGYDPASIDVPVNQPITLSFLRTDPTSCLEELYIPDLKIKKTLPLNQEVPVSFTVSKPGEYPFHCGMNMFHGRIVAH